VVSDMHACTGRGALARGRGARRLAVLLLVLGLSGALGAALGGDTGTVERLEREAERDERGADAEAEKAIQLDRALGDSATTQRYSKLEHEIDDDGGGAGGKALDRQHDEGDAEEEGNSGGSGADVVPGETSVESLVEDGKKFLTMVEDVGAGQGKGAGGHDRGHDENEFEPRDLRAEAEVEGGCLVECQGSCTSECYGSLQTLSKDDMAQCGRKCEKKCEAICQEREGKGTAPPAPNSRAARMKRRQDAKTARDTGKEIDVPRAPSKKWGWQVRMEEDEAAGKLVGPAPVKGRPMDEECKKDCMGTCSRKCNRKSRTPEKCPKQCDEQCADDCYIVEDGAPPAADVFMPGNGEEGLGDEPNKLMKRCMGECQEQCMPPCSARGDAAPGLPHQSRRQVEIAIHLNCSQACRESCLGSCEPMVTRRVEDIRQDLRNREHKFFGKEEPRPAGSDKALKSPSYMPSADEVVAQARFSDFGDFGFQSDQQGSEGRGAARGQRSRERKRQGPRGVRASGVERQMDFEGGEMVQRNGEGNERNGQENDDGYASSVMAGDMGTVRVSARAREGCRGVALAMAEHARVRNSGGDCLLSAHVRAVRPWSCCGYDVRQGERGGGDRR